MLIWFRWTTLMIALFAASFYGYRAIPWSCMDMTVTAYWVQAVGSITAILGSFALAKSQAKRAEKIRNIERLEANYTIAKMALRLAIDTIVCLDNTAGRIEDRIKKPRAVGPERLDQLQASLHSFSNKDIPAEILSEVLILQREVAYTHMAIREIGARRPSPSRVEKAEKRTARVIRCRNAIREIAKNCRAEWQVAKA